MDYRIFRKPRLKDGKRTYHWYYYYLEKGRQVQKSCKKCRTRAEAEAYVSGLPPLGGAQDILVKTIAQSMYIPGGPHMSRREQLGKPLVSASTLEGRRMIGLILKEWGERTLKSLTVEEVGNYLFAKKRSGSWKIIFLRSLKEIYREAGWYGVSIPVPGFPSFAQKSKKADIFTTEELKNLFKSENFPNHEAYLFFLCSLSAGLRIGEAAAIRAKQIIPEYKALIVDGFCRPDGERMKYNKKGSDENPRVRVVPLSDFVLGLLVEHIKGNNIGGEELCFRSPRNEKKPMGHRCAERMLRSAIKKAGIEVGGRKLVPHSLRYTYVTLVRRELPAEMVMKLVGHTSVTMTEYYNRKVLDQMLKGLPGAGSAVENLFN